MSDYFCFYQCRECGMTATGGVTAPEPDGWDYDDEDCEWLCPGHAIHCPTCDRTNEDEESVNCSNVWHLTGENRIPKPRPYTP